jgi:hypothetical protein
MEGAFNVVRMPESGRLRTSSPYSSSIDDNEYLASTGEGFRRLEFSQLKLARSERPVEEYAAQSAFGFFTMVDGKVQTPGKCVFIGTNTEFRDNHGDCRSWEPGQPEPPKF